MALLEQAYRIFMQRRPPGERPDLPRSELLTRDQGSTYAKPGRLSVMVGLTQAGCFRADR